MSALPVHPGEILRLEFLQPLQITQYRLAKELGVPAARICEIIGGRRAISIDTAWRLHQYFGNTVQFWLSLQHNYDLRVFERGNPPNIPGTKARSAHRHPLK